MTSDETKRLDELIPECRALVEQLIAAMGARGYGVYVGDTLRTAAQQHDAQARGTTSAHQSTSWHQLGRAADLRAYLSDGVTVDKTVNNTAFFLALYEEATALGLRSLAYHEVNGQLVKLYIHTAHGAIQDAGHVEYRQPFATLAEAIVAEGSKVA